MDLRSVAEAWATSPQQARASLEEANAEIQALLVDSPGNALFRRWLATNLALLGRHDEALREAKLAVDVSARDRYEGPGAFEEMALVYTLAGRYDEAIDVLARLLTSVYASPMTPHWIELWPVWDPLRDHPRYHELVPENI